VKLAPGVNSTNIFEQLLQDQIPKAQKVADDLTVFLRFWIFVNKSCTKACDEINPTNLFSSLTLIFQCFAIKIGHFMVNTFFIMVQTLKLNIKSWKNKVW
jgi:hypothetical protein